MAIYPGGKDTSIESAPAYSCYEMTTPLQLTTTKTLITGFTEVVTPKNISYDSGIFTIAVGGTYKFELERIYTNTDTNPADIVEVTFTIEGGGATVFSRTYALSAATSNNEPAILSFTTPNIASVTTGDEIKMYVSATDGGVDPELTYLSLARVTSHKIYD